jgi:hypothetical protein
MNTERQGDAWIVTDDVSGRVIRVPLALTVGIPPVYYMRQFLTRCMLAPESVAGVTIVSEGPHGMTPDAFRAMVPPHLWHPEVREHPTGGGRELHHVRERRRLALLHKAKLGKLTLAEREPLQSAPEGDSQGSQE